MSVNRTQRLTLTLTLVSLLAIWAAPAAAQVTVSYLPYIQPGDNGSFGPKDQMIVTWQTNESSPVTGAFTVEFGKSPSSLTTTAPVSARIVDNYLAADHQFDSLTLPFKYGAHSNYTAVLSGLDYDTTYIYKVTGPGLAGGSFSSSFHTRKRGGHFVFQVQGDEGYYPGIPNTNPTVVANYEARIINTMFNVASVSIPGQPAFTAPDFALNMGDNVYTTGGDDNYRDIWMHDWNNDNASNDGGAPFVRSIPLYIVAGNHDVGSTGATANLLADSGDTIPGTSGPGPFGGGLGGGDAMAYFNNYYFPLNGPEGVDIQNHFTGDVSAPTNFLFTYNNVSYTSPVAIEALRASTDVDGGKGPKRQIDHMSNYSFDYGNAHYVFLDANPHLFDNLLPGGPPATAVAFPFPHYPSVLRDWLTNDLDASDQTWKFVVFHQPIFSSGNATITNDQMRTIGQFLQDHGVNMVFNGHEHNYQRSLPLRALPNVTNPPSPGAPQVEVDQKFDGSSDPVPDGVLYFVEGAGGNRDFDDNTPNPRGGGTGIDQDDAATGTNTQMIGSTAYTFVNGPASVLDTSLTDDAMKVFLTNPGSGTKITTKFKSKVFSFAHVTVDDNVLTLYQISEPLTTTSSATAQNPAPFGSDYQGKPLNDPIPDTVFDPVARKVISSSGTGTPALLDKITVIKPDISEQSEVELSGPRSVHPGSEMVLRFSFQNESQYPLNGSQAVVKLPVGVSFESASTGTATTNGEEVVVSLGRLVPEQSVTLEIRCRVANSVTHGSILRALATLRSSTALPVIGEASSTRVVREGSGRGDDEGGKDGHEKDR
ncbi:MAG TPA: metallophosphoesterase family protein [Vicinamibacterales bacterium]|jgi:hypothetical protein|nr:metallophosphoesterase family protein [Vicinamibacterales bacterium]